ncbi:hypothetical protein SLEP1_g41922 [Rubroshorea leprosula]|uniref:Uncharacterized protein n=1 Tax=Rubroshorea leprosula TaxID=152421 RepID=A0AAV5L826_9ROSI|nr:hypothetical protein SLEP1_g41922 [Rubroshorea leprosula]
MRRSNEESNRIWRKQNAENWRAFQAETERMQEAFRRVKIELQPQAADLQRQNKNIPAPALGGQVNLPQPPPQIQQAAGRPVQPDPVEVAPRVADLGNHQHPRYLPPPRRPNGGHQQHNAPPPREHFQPYVPPVQQNLQNLPGYSTAVSQKCPWQIYLVWCSDLEKLLRPFWPDFRRPDLSVELPCQNRNLSSWRKMVARYENLLREDTQRKSASHGTYYGDANFDLDVAEVVADKPVVCPDLVKVAQQTDRINKIDKGILRFPDKAKETMGVDADPFPTMSVGVNAADLRSIARDRTQTYYRRKLAANDLRWIIEEARTRRNQFRSGSYRRRQPRGYNSTQQKNNANQGTAISRRAKKSRMVKPPPRSPTKWWERVVHPKFPKGQNPRTLRRRLQHKRAAERHQQQITDSGGMADQAQLLPARRKSVWVHKEKGSSSCQNSPEKEEPPRIPTSPRVLAVESNEETGLKAKFDVSDKAKNSSGVICFGEFFVNLSCLVITLPLVFQAREQPESAVCHQTDLTEEEEVIEIPAKEEGGMDSADKIIFEKPEERMAKHIRPLYIQAHLDGMPINRVLVDSGAAVNVLPTCILHKIGKSLGDLMETEVTISDFTGGVNRSRGILRVELTVGNRTLMCAFFVVDTIATYNALLGRDWIHSSWCVPSTLHQKLIFWNGGRTEVVTADDRPFVASTNAGEARYYDEDIGTICFFGMDRYGRPSGITACTRSAMDSQTVKDVCYELFRPIAIVPFRSREEPEIEEEDLKDQITLEELDLALAKLDDLKAEVQDPLLAFLLEIFWDIWCMSEVWKWIRTRQGKTRVFSPLLKLKSKVDFKWEKHHQTAFEEIKHYLSKPPILVPPLRGKPLILYISAADESIGCLLAQENSKKHEQAVYYLSRSLSQTEVKYSSVEKLCLALFFAAIKLRHYLLYSEVYVISKIDVIKYMLSRPLLRGRIGKWVLALSEFNLKYMLEKAVKGTDSMFGAGIIIISPAGLKTQMSFQLDFNCTNNQAEYEALIIGLEVLVELKLLEEFDDVILRHVTRDLNTEANEMAQIASGLKIPEGVMSRIVVVEKRILPSIHMRGMAISACSIDITQTDWRYPIMEYLKNPNFKASRRTKMQALNYVLLEGVLYRRGHDELLLRCLGPDEYCQRVPASELHPIVKPWPFRGWAIDLIGKVYPPSTRGHSFIIVATDYFTKWVEAKPMKKVDQTDIIKFLKEEIIYRFGLPETVTSDQGTVFVGAQVEAFAKEMGFRLLTSTPHYAQAEASNRIVINLLEKMVDDNPRCWHELLSDTIWAYRTSQRSSTKVTPFSLTYGHDAVLPMELSARSLRIAIQHGLTSGEYNEAMILELEDLEEGDLVWKVILPPGKKDPRFGKWSPNWEGPFRIHEVLRGGAYWLESLNEELHPRKINGIYLKPYYPMIWEARGLDTIDPT